MMDFVIDARLSESAYWLASWPLSEVFFKNDARFPWVMLVPRVTDIEEIYELSESEQLSLMREINVLSVVMKKQFSPKKLNIGALGNMVSQLHVHIVGRNEHDEFWPQSIWQDGASAIPYEGKAVRPMLRSLQNLIMSEGHDLFDKCFV